MKFSVAYMVLGLAVSGPALAQSQIPAAAFGRLPAVQQAVISPDGQKIAILGGTAADRTVSIATVDKPDIAVLRLGKVETVGIRWAANAYVLVQTAQWDNSLEKVAYRLERTYAITPNAKVASRLLDNSVDSNLAISQPIVGVSSGEKPRVLMLGLHDAGEAEHDANTRFKRKGSESSLTWAMWSVDPANGNGAIAELGDFDAWAWDTDAEGQARVRLETDELTRKYTIMARPKGKTAWSAVYSEGQMDDHNAYFGYSDPDDAIYLSKEDATGLQIVRQSLKDGAATPLGRSVQDADLSLVMDVGLKTAVGVELQGKANTVEWLDPGIGAIHGVLAKIFKGKRVELQSWSADRTRFLATVESADQPPTWYLFDIPKKALSPIGEAYPELKDVALGTTRAMSFKARDGLEIPAYLTLPPGAPASRSRLPLIVMPHGGPAGHDDPGFDYLTQFLATRGYAVLRPEFRGSDGYGSAFEKAGHGEWAGKMQTDLLDGVAALAATGDIDPKRVCIFGWSFGGFAALAGATLHPEDYRCAASMAGVADVTLMIREQARSYGSESESLKYWRRELGHANLEQQSAMSPLQHVDAVKVPILLMHGDRDTIVLPEQSQRMAAALTKAGKSVEMVTLAGDDHYLMQSPTRIQMLETLGAFLATNLPVKP